MGASSMPILVSVLKTLELRDFAIVDELMLGLEPGLNVLTGETGAGKSILVDALGLLAGGRADVGFIRNGQESALVQGMFAAGDVFAAARRLVAGSRNTARLNGELVSVAELSQAGGRLLAVFGQYASQALLDQAWQRDQLDRLLPQAATRSLEAYRATYARLRTVEREFETLEGAARDRERQLDMLRFQQDEIDAANLAFGEEEALQEELVALRNAERIALALAEASATLEVSETNAADLLGTAQKALNAAARFHPFPATLAEELRGLSSSIRAVAQEVAHFLETFEADPGRLDQAETRLATLERLKRKYGADIAAVLSYRDQVAAQLTQLENVEHDLATLAQERDTLVGDLAHQGASVSKARARAGPTLAKKVQPLLKRLGMAKASFQVALEAAETPTPNGMERVHFGFSANLGEARGPLQARASGGELSRVMLALNLVTGASQPTLIFDEIDAGVGGRTARAVGALLSQLAQQHQVLVVTHLPQVAAFADAQFSVYKEEERGRTLVRVARLDRAEREQELARMLFGTVTKASLGAARELLSEAHPASPS